MRISLFTSQNFEMIPMTYRVLALLFLLCSSVMAADWPQHLGPLRTGHSAETNLISSWPANGLKTVWKVPGGVGMSGIAVSQSKAVTLIQKDGKQFAIALDVKTGQTKWETVIAPAYTNAMGNGPRAFPAIAKGQAFVFSGEGILASIDLETGKLNWKHDTIKEYKGKVADYGMAASPLVVGNFVIVTTGHQNGVAIAAYSVENGEFMWQTNFADPIGYSCPAFLEVAGVKQLVVFTGSHLRGLSTLGDPLWEYRYVTAYDCNIVTPLIVGKDIFISSGEDHGAVRLKITKSGDDYSLEEVWSSQGRTSVMRNEWQTSLLHDNHLFGFDNIGGAGPITNLNCINAETGKLAWQVPRFGKGNAIAADGKLFISMMNGDLIVARLDTTEYSEIGMQKVTRGTRQAPTLSDGVLLLRDDESIYAIDVKAKQ
tara:strand:- start:158 stop:1441 length:1284 start_codon:yes stop_codon:yes gene_type:complete